MEEEIKTGKGQAASSFIWRFLEKGFTFGTGLLVQIILARIIAPDQYGSLAIIVTITNFAALFVQAGVSTALIQKKEIDGRDIYAVVFLSSIIATVVYGLLFFLAPVVASFYNYPVLKNGLRVLSLCIFFNAYYSIRVALFQRDLKFKALFFRCVIPPIISGIIGIILAVKGFEIWALIIHTLLTSILNCLAVSVKSHFSIERRLDRQKVKAIYSFSLKILITNLISGICDLLRTLIIGKKYSSEDLAYFDKGYTYAMYVSQVLKESSSSVALPILSKKQDDIRNIHDSARKAIRLIAFSSFPVFIGLILVSNELIPVLLKEKWVSCIPFFQLFLLMRLLELLKIIDVQVYYSIGRSEIQMYYWFGFSLISTVSVVICAQISTLAVAFAITVLELVSFIIVQIISCKVFAYKVSERFRDLFKPTINTLVMAASITAFSYFAHPGRLIISLICKILIGVLSYLLMCLITKDDNITMVMSFINKK